jgi:hypothetical protein
LSLSTLSIRKSWFELISWRHLFWRIHLRIWWGKGSYLHTVKCYAEQFQLLCYIDHKFGACPLHIHKWQETAWGHWEQQKSSSPMTHYWQKDNVPGWQ